MNSLRRVLKGEELGQELGIAHDLPETLPTFDVEHLDPAFISYYYYNYY